MKTVKIYLFRIIFCYELVHFFAYRSICSNCFLTKFEHRTKLTLCLWNTETVVQYPLFEKHKESSRINTNIFKYREF